MAISDDVYRMILKKQLEIFDEKGMKMKISNIIEEAVKKGIYLVGDNSEYPKKEWSSKEQQSAVSRKIL